ncbi:uncharacterized protein FMAN_06526 [Fusarium mangiferae]|uniref:Uncharacterized protein n=1 Tax=Fusarium mangiferae TaxID=192010 RepID=A0A1L7SNR7_FUSMA|nr:uncharacterized protein FMAN_06526 [Fusarium mangiferae]CVK86063.1 uncharacterized protein FMAN_06526 [Fusarium mangiferae]
MFARILLFTALLIVPLAYFLSHQALTQHAPYFQGRIKTLIFLTNSSEHGLSNVHLATASAILENYPDIEVHFASFPFIEPKLERIPSFAKIKSPHAKTIVFHGLTGLKFVQAIAKEGRSFISPPGWGDIGTLAKHIQLWISPWTFEDHVHLYKELGDIIDEVDPAVIVLDRWFRDRPSSGFPFPVPLLKLPENGAMIPVEVLPPNVTCAGPIILSGPPADQQDPETATWLKKAPTLLINLGSNLAYDESRAELMAIAIAVLLSSTEYQVLWKFNKLGDFSDDFLVHLKPYLDNEGLRMPSWLVADPSSLLDTGNIVTSVHHGGSNCYHEALAAGVTEVILPLWADLYNYAALAETRGIGVWGCKDSTPNWTSECLLDAFMKGIDGCGESFLQRRAKYLGDRIKAGKKGRDVAADEIAKLAYVK